MAFSGVAKSYDGVTMALEGLDLTVRSGEFLTLLGPSGCGKTTTLRLLAGFEEPTAGEIRIEGVPVASVPAYRRPVNTVFQHYALFPHMSVADNVAFGLRMRKLPAQEVRTRVDRALALVRLSHLGRRRPKELSGGQQQRVALARALVLEPKVLLLDEPLGALDLQLRRAMQVELKQLQRELGMTFIYVTHDQEEALAMSDRIAVMNGGRLEQLDTPEQVYLRPATRFVAQFLGEANLLEGETDGDGLLHWGGVPVRVGAGLTPGHAVVALRPERVTVYAAGTAPAPRPAPGAPGAPGAAPRTAGAAPVNMVTGRVLERLFVGTGTRLVVTIGDARLTVLMPPGPAPHPGDAVTLAFAPEHCVVVAP